MPAEFLSRGLHKQNQARVDWIEERLLFELQRAVLRPEAVDYALEEF
jgi:hypothetical protein